MADIKVPDEILLPPNPNPTKEEEEHNKALIDYTRAVRDSFSELEDLEAITAGTGLTDTSSTFSVNVDDSTIEISGGDLQVKDDGITTDKIADDNVTGAKLASDVAGDGLTQDGSGNLDVSVDNSSIEISGDALQIKDGGVTTLSLADITSMTVLGNVGTTTNNPSEVNIIDDDTMATASDTTLATSESIKAYVDSATPSESIELTDSGTFSSSGSVSITQTISSGDIYMLCAEGYNNGNFNIALRVNNDSSGSNYDYYLTGFENDGGQSAVLTGSASADEIRLYASTAHNGTWQFTAYITARNSDTQINGKISNTESIIFLDFIGRYDAGTPTSIQIVDMGGGSDLTGSYRLYKLNTS